MKKVNAWDIVTKEVAIIAKAIESGEFKTRKDYNDYLESIYNWRLADAISSVISVYISVNDIDIAWDNEKEETAE